ncbi:MULTISPECIES: hypothetical protein [unclassified Streptomyces]|jgi:hypothetical protein|uniref:hypothetical protein n=1 Tax=unclassified Streptomyces TaxID=2593676 RepID=UPI0001D065D4|nr:MULTISPECIES: hypothetical protein [unclassified Streptomyces]MYS40399.1 hypothetical protein [Streptomyces sp. SID5998]NED77452.1 hypothetical protein [Streptomyces sp. SID9944]EFF88336.1 hypothetical protein SSTG_05985 [Streptomyces sp. e14]MYX31090.1 hypothetical protein [Streptomyces sp. SID8381]NED37197.1 hypothetical protein [Streptomyces sp. SID8499]
MRKFQKAAVVVAMLGSVGFIGAGAAQAHGGDGGLTVDSKQTQTCTGQVDSQQGLINVQDLGVAANALIGVGNPVGKATSVACGSTVSFG